MKYALYEYGSHSFLESLFDYFRYAYSDESTEKFDDDEAIPLKSSTATGIEAEKGSLKHEKKERRAVNTDVFSLEDEPEEDKRE
jgi:hypothetical protein